MIVFLDESGLSTRPTRVRTWALRGQTPLIQETFNWKSLSIIGGLALLWPPARTCMKRAGLKLLTVR